MATTPCAFIAGATGLLGTRIVDAALDKDLRVKALVRDVNPKDPTRRMQLENWTERGVELIQGDVLNLDTLKASVTGSDIVVSAVGNIEPILDLGQKNLIYACKTAGVKRFVPSDFSVDYFKVDLGDNYNLNYRITTFAFLEESGVPWTSVLNGAFTEVQFTDFAGLLDLGNSTFSYWGDGDTPCDFTLTDDAAAYTVAAALDPEMENNICRVAGDVLTMKEVKTAFEDVTGIKLTEVCKGSVAEFEDWIAAKKRSALSHYEYLAAQYHWLMVSGKGKLEPLDNKRYPEVRPVTVREYLSRTFT